METSQEKVLESRHRDHKPRRSDRLALAANILNCASLVSFFVLFNYVDSFREKRDAYAQAAADAVAKQCKDDLEKERADRIAQDAGLAGAIRDVNTNVSDILKSKWGK